MTLENILLAKLAEAQPNNERHELTITDGPWTVQVVFDRRDDLSGRLWEVALHRNCALGGTVEDWAKRVVQRVTGLLEPLAIIEIDAGKEEAMLRSAQPAKRGDKLFYYEVRLRHLAQATVRRFEASHEPGQKRRQISFTLTHEALAKLVGDIVAV